MKFANLISKFYYEPWCIRADKHAAMGKLLHDYLTARIQAGDVVGPTWPDGEPVIPQMEVHSGVALIPVFGVLGKHLSFLELMCGGCDYEHISQMIDQAVEDPTIHTLIFNINSPGGMVVGLPELAEKIIAVGQSRHTIAYADVECCSSAQWLAAACNEVYFAPSAIVACIGCYLAAIDDSRAWENEGLRRELFRSGKLKAIGLSGKEFTDDERKFMQDRADRGGEQFRAFIRARRGNVPESAMQGQWLDGDEALAVRLCDGLVNELPALVAAAIAGGRPA